MDRKALHDAGNDLAVALASVYAFTDGKLAPDAENLAAVLESLERLNAFFSELRPAPAVPDRGNEELLGAIVEGSPYAKVLVNGDGLITLVNQQTEKLFGYAREELLGQPVEILVPERFRAGHPALRTSFHRAPVARPMGVGRDLYGRRKDGSDVPIEIGLNPIKTDEGLFTLAAITDITERRRAEEQRLLHASIAQHAAEVEELNRELARASQFKSQFVATMSHELRTPLTAIVGAAELLGRVKVEQQAQIYVQTINEAAEALLSIVNSILDLSKIEAGKLELEHGTFSLESVLDGVADVTAQLAASKGLTLHTFLDPAIPPLQGDADRLRQILQNLLGNAVKFTDRGYVVARASVAAADEEAITLRFEVEDSGPGIAADVQTRLFEPFVQGDASSTRKAGGTGLGLSISKRLVELMGGEIGVTSELGNGSLFWFTAPFARAGDAYAPQQRALRGGGLIVSNDEIFAAIVERYLSSWGMESHRGRSRADILGTMQSAQAANWLAIADLDTITPEQRTAVDSVQAAMPSRVIAVGALGNLRKPLRQSYLFDAIVSRVGPLSEERRGTPAASAPADADAGEHRPILVAEDNVQLQRLLKLQFDALGVPVTFVSDGRQAVEAVRDGSYAMVFMDCQMPVMDGLEAARAIRAEEAGSNRHIPIAAMTANAFAEDRAASLAAGMDDHLAKPVKLESLRNAIERWGRTIT